MAGYKKLLVAYDGSASSDNALLQAFSFANKERAWIKVLAVVPSYEGDIDMTGVGNIEAVLKGPGEKLVAQAREIAAKERVSILTDIEQGEAYEKIIEVAEDENCDIIVMGRRGIGNVERMIMGSVTARVVAQSPVDVLVIPKDSVLGWSRILLATDGSACSEAAADKAIAFASAYGCALSVVSVVHVNTELYAEAPKLVEKLVEKAKGIVESVRGKASKSGINIDAYVKEGDPHQEIAQLAEESKANLIVLGSHGRTGIRRLLMGSVAEKVIGNAHCPVLITKSS